MEEENFEGCISCMKTKDLCNLFAAHAENAETYAKMLETCFNIKVSDDLKYICAECVEKLKKAIAFKDQTVSMLKGIKDLEYLDESLLEEDGVDPEAKSKVETPKKSDYDSSNVTDESESPEMGADEDTTCIYCDMVLPSLVGLHNHIRVAHGIQPRSPDGPRHPCELCHSVFLTGTTLREHMERCHGVVRAGAGDGKQFPCHFCENVYTGRKACYTHLRMKHGLKLSTEQTPKYTPRVRKKCHICNKDFSQKQILNKHLWKEHGYEVEKRKAFICPLCSERVSYGHHFDEHLMTEHRLKQHVEELQFPSMDDFMIYKSQIQEETRCRFRKTTASKHTIEGLRSHYMCSQSGVYVYQGKGIRPAPERQIYKTGKACPAHMVVTETVTCVRVVFHMTHVGHGACPYYEPREPKKLKLESTAAAAPAHTPLLKEESDDGDDAEAGSWICDACGLGFESRALFEAHSEQHGVRLLSCHYCPTIFQNVDAWTRHLNSEHDIKTIF